MPLRAPSACNEPGCSGLTNKRFCDKHERKRQQLVDSKRPSAAKRGYGSKWRRLSKLFLQKNPLCTICLASGIVKASELVDHIKPHLGNKILVWLQSNWQALCWSCHSKKTAKEDGGFGNRKNHDNRGG